MLPLWYAILNLSVQFLFAGSRLKMHWPWEEPCWSHLPKSLYCKKWNNDKMCVNPCLICHLSHLSLKTFLWHAYSLLPDVFPLLSSAFWPDADISCHKAVSILVVGDILFECTMSRCHHFSSRWQQVERM